MINERRFRQRRRESGITLLSVLALPVIICIACSSAPESGDSPKAKIFEEYLIRMAERGAFNGNVLVAEGGKVIYRRSLGWRSTKPGDHLDGDTQFCLASASKPFTAFAIMRLKEEGLLDYDDPIRKFIPEWPYDGGTVRHLLNNTSGFPGHVYLLRDPLQPWLWDSDTARLIRNHEQMIDLYRDLQPEPHFPPGTRYHSSGTDYVLLACIVERVSGMPFSRYVRENVFLPAGMKNSFIVSPFREDSLSRRAYGIAEAMDGSGLVSLENRHQFHWEGASGVYSTLDDLFRFDRILYTDRLFSKASLDRVFTLPDEGSGTRPTFFFGWSWIPVFPGIRAVSLTGHAEGFGAGIIRELDTQNTIIILTNYDLFIWGGLIQNLIRILHGKEYELPPRSIGREFARVLLTEGEKEARRHYAEKKLTAREDYEWDANQLDEFGHLMLREHLFEQAIQIFQFNLEQYPESPLAWNGLGDGHLALGGQDTALAYYRKAAELAPNFKAMEYKISLLEDRLSSDK